MIVSSFVLEMKFSAISFCEYVCRGSLCTRDRFNRPFFFFVSCGKSEFETFFTLTVGRAFELNHGKSEWRNGSLSPEMLKGWEQRSVLGVFGGRKLRGGGGGEEKRKMVEIRFHRLEIEIPALCVK